jgi:hypothetical protein
MFSHGHWHNRPETLEHPQIAQEISGITSGLDS